MTRKSKSSTGVPLSGKQETWQSTNWQAASKLVIRLQMRIAKATMAKKYNKVKALQRLLSHSSSAKIIAVKKVSSNKGSKTAGIDGEIWTSNYSGFGSVSVIV